MPGTTSSPLWMVIILAFIASGIGTAIVTRLLDWPKSRKADKRANTDGDVSVANIFREDNMTLRAELRQVWEMMRQQADQIASLREKMSDLEDHNRDYEEQLETAQGKIITLEGEVSRLSKENELLRNRGNT